jgi:LPS-assembly lipoprotein
MSLGKFRIAARLIAVVALAGLTAGCFQPMYAEHADGTPGLREKLMGVEIPPIDKPNASPEARVGVAIRNALAFKLYGSATGVPPTHRLVIRFTDSRSSLLVDVNTGLPTTETVGIDAQFNLIEISTGKSVLTGTTFSRASYDMPGSYQRFARQRASRDAEDRAAQEIADNINTRLAAFFAVGT